MTQVIASTVFTRCLLSNPTLADVTATEDQKLSRTHLGTAETAPLVAIDAHAHAATILPAAFAPGQNLLDRQLGGSMPECLDARMLAIHVHQECGSIHQGSGDPAQFGLCLGFARSDVGRVCRRTSRTSKGHLGRALGDQDRAKALPDEKISQLSMTLGMTQTMALPVLDGATVWHIDAGPPCSLRFNGTELMALEQ